ncbi:unnamed protein product [Tenebrio molitor]|nr:unnamed protein product [Tenebrio molitor]
MISPVERGVLVTVTSLIQKSRFLSFWVKVKWRCLL